MAFNPFNFFRRNQKAILAGLAILCMFVFILSFGAGDFFTMAQGWFQGPRDRGSVVATLYGNPVHEGDLNRLQYHRQLASEFLFSTLFRHQEQITQPRVDLTGNLVMLPKKADLLVTMTPGLSVQEVKVGGVLGSVTRNVIEHIAARGRRFGQPLTVEQQRSDELGIRADLDVLRNALLLDRSGDGKTAAYEDKSLSLDQRGAYDELITFLQFELYRVAPGSNFPDLFRGHVNQPTLNSNKTFFLGGGRTTEELLDFVVWKQQADKLGIHPTDSAVLRLALAYAGQKAIPANPTFADHNSVQQFLAMRRDSDRLTTEEVADALRDDVRVALAREALTGQLPAGTFPAIALSLLPTVPAQASLGEGYAEFQRLTTTANMSLLEVPVSAFLGQVTGQPTDKELQVLFDKYKNDEPRPDRDRPAFKEPRRARVQYLHISGTSAFMLAQAIRARLLGEAVKPAGVALAAGLAHGGIGSHPFVVPGLVAALQPDSLLTEDHEAYKAAPRNQLASWLEDDYFSFTRAEFEKYGMHDSSWMRAGPTAPLVAHLMGASLNASGTPLTALTDWAANVYRFESGDRSYYQKRIATALGPSFLPNGEFASGVLLAVMRKSGELPEPVAMQTLAPMYRQARVDSLARNIRGGLMREAFDKLKTLRGKTEKEAAPILDAFLKERGIEGALQGTPYAMDAFDLAKTPTIEGIARLTGQAGAVATDLALRLSLNSRGTYEAQRFSSRFNDHFREARGLSQAAREEDAWSRALGDPQAMLVWRSEDREAAVPAGLDAFVWDKGERVKVREKVLAAWKWQQAQLLAEKYAQGIRAKLLELRGKQEVSATVQWLREQKVGTTALAVKELKGRGRLVKEPSPILTDPTYVPGDIPADVIAMPRADTLDQLLSAFKERGDAAVVPDRPAGTWYVALAEDLDVPKEADYISALNAVKTLILSGQGGSLPNGFYAAHLTPANERAFDEKLISQLRLEACKDQDRIDASGRWRLPASLRVNYERSEAGD